MSDEPEVPTEHDRIAGRLVAVALVATIVAIVASAFVVWLVAARIAHGGGRSDEANLVLEPPADPFDQITMHERARLQRVIGLDAWSWADSSHARVRVPLEIAIDRYLAAGAP